MSLDTFSTTKLQNNVYCTGEVKGGGRVLCMQLTTDYAIRIMIYLAQQKVCAKSNDIAQALGITPSNVKKVIHKLKNAGIIYSAQGSTGGYRLEPGAKKITLHEIIRLMEGDICLNACLQKNGFCSRFAQEHCPVHKLLAGLQQSIVTTLQGVSIESMITAEKRKGR